MSIRNKLILMLVLPLLALALVGAIGFRGQSATARLVNEALEDDNVIQSLNTSIKAIGAERLALADGDTQFTQLANLQAATDVALLDVTVAAEDANVLPLVEELMVDVTAEVARARSLDSLLTNRLSSVITELNQATRQLRGARDAFEVSYPDQESFAEATSIDLAVDIADRQDSIWLEYIATSAVTSDLVDRMRAELAATEVLRDQIIDIAPDSHFASLSSSLSSGADSNIEQANASAIDLFERGFEPLDPGTTIDIVTASHDDWYGHAIELQTDVSSSLGELADDAESRQNLFALLGTLGLLVLFGLIYVVYRSVVRPLEELLVGAERVATDRLPTVVSELRTMGSSDQVVRLEPLPRDSNDELGSLVDAFNDVQLTAFDLAVEQARSRRNIAEMFVNLGRRNQKLLQRMLGVISELEHDEKNADKLEALFQLDHMTTRMRRNAESLLVVAGTTSPRQWSKPVPAANVVRSALAEVADYHRIDILTLVEAPMAGNAVADITHLLAELLENSLQFSEPETRVTVTSRWKDGDYHIVIGDHGFGMSEEELGENNALIANPPAPDEAPTRFLGLFVVGHLAKRHGIRVLLSDGAIGGTDARITIPAAIMTEAKPIDVTSTALPSRGDDLDLDAELAALTESEELRKAEEEAHAAELDATAPTIIAEPTSDASEALDAGLPVRGGGDIAETVEMPAAPAGQTPINFDDAPELPSFDEVLAPAPVAEAPTAPVVDAPVVLDTDLPVRGEAPAAPVAEVPAPPAPMAPAPAPVAEAPAAISTELPVRGQAPAAPVAAVPAPVAQAPAPAAAAPAEIMGLPTRTPRATLPEPIPAVTEAAAAPAAEAEDVTATANTVGSAFSAFQAGIQRGERTTN